VRNLELIDAVIALHDIAKTVEREVGCGQLSDDIRKCADRLHELSIADSRNSVITQNIINKAKE
jgi:23S rRNA maturation-related 3'-5' exoribonuclease YhaM